MTGTVTINGVTYNVDLTDLTPADVIQVFRTDTSVVKSDSILLHSSGTEENSAKMVLLPHLISLLSNSVAEDVALTIEPYYDENDEYVGMFWHYNGDWLLNGSTGEMIRVDTEAAAAALAASQATEAAETAVQAASEADHARELVEGVLEQADSDHDRAEADHERAEAATEAAGTQAARAKGYNDHPWEIRGDGYIYVWDEASGQMVRTNRMILSWADLTAAERQSIIDAIAGDVGYASVAESETAAQELT